MQQLVSFEAVLFESARVTLAIYEEHQVDPSDGRQVHVDPRAV